VVTTVTVREKDRTLEEAGGIVMTVRSWTTDDVTGMQEIADFQRRYAQAQVAEAPKPEKKRRGRFGGLGGLGNRVGRALGGGGDDSAGEPRSTIFETTSELLNIDNAPDTSLVTIPADFREK